MSELFLELFSEEIPVSLQKNIRENLVIELKKVFEDKSIKFKKYFSLSTPNRLVVVFQNLDKEVKIKSEEIKGPSTSSPTEALEGFLKSQKITKKQIKLKTSDLIKENLPKILIGFKWKKSMKWGSYDLNWARPLKSVLCLFDKKVINFSIGHLRSSNFTFLDKDFEERKKTFTDFNTYQKSLEQSGTILDQDKRKDFIKKEIEN